MANNIEELKPRKVKAVATEVEATEDVVETPEVEVATTESEAKKTQRAIYAAYKIQNPVKYEQKKPAFEEKLAKMQ